jgi:hypothetical protein
MRHNFAALILCHGRPDNTPTYQTLRNFGYTGQIYIVCDDEDKTVDGYRKNFGEDSVKLFSKTQILKEFDTMDNTGDRRCAVYARNACFEIAKNLGLEYFCELDDDYTTIPYRWEENGKLYRSSGANLDEVFDAYIDFMETNENIYSVAFGQPGDFIGGVGSQLHKRRYRRKTMNSWICKTSRKFVFNGTMNDDVNTYMLNGHRGKIFLTFDFIMIDQPETQQVKGGMTDMYLGNGTYMKSFYTILCCPSFCNVSIMGDRHYRIHHGIEWENAVPKIISGKYKKQL